MKTLLIALFVYGVLCTVLQVAQHRRKAALPKTSDKLRAAIDGLEDESKKIDALIELAKVEQVQTPWWERSISTMGIVAFASMSVAVTVQTINSSLGEAKFQAAQDKIEQFQTELKSSSELIEVLAQGALRRHLELGERDEASMKLLEFRLSQIENKLHKEPKDLQEAYALAFAVEKYDVAFSLLKSHPDMLNETTPDDMVTLGEYFFISGSKAQAGRLTETARDNFSALSRSGKLRLLTLDSAVKSEIDRNVPIVQSLLGVSAESARLTLIRGVSNLKKASSQIAPAIGR